MTVRCHYLIDFMVFLVCVRVFTMETIRNEYMYEVVSFNHNYTTNGTLDICTANGSTHSDEEKIVADEVSMWSIRANLAGGLTSFVSGLLLTSWSDKVGRKIPLAVGIFGLLVTGIMQTLAIFLRFPLYFLVINEAICGIFGYSSTLLHLSLAYLSDVVRQEEKTRRFTILECVMGLGGSVSSFGTGFWIKPHGYAPSSCFAAACSAVALIVIPLLPTVKHGRTARTPNDATNSKSVISPIESGKHGYGTNDEEELSRNDAARINPAMSFSQRMKSLWRICATDKSICALCDQGHTHSRCIHGGGLRKGRTWKLWLFIIILSSYVFAVDGPNFFQTMYLLSYPLCFDAVLIGAQRGLLFTLLALLPLVVKFYYSVLHLTNLTAIMTGVISRLLVNVLLGIAKRPNMVFIATGISIFANMTTPFIRAEISSLVSISEQGTVFGLLSCLYSATDLITMFTFLELYPATLYISNGFAWLCSAIILCVPLVLVIILKIAGKRNRGSADAEREALVG